MFYIDKTKIYKAIKGHFGTGTLIATLVGLPVAAAAMTTIIIKLAWAIVKITIIAVLCQLEFFDLMISFIIQVYLFELQEIVLQPENRLKIADANDLSSDMLYRYHNGKIYLTPLDALRYGIVRFITDRWLKLAIYKLTPLSEHPFLEYLGW